jgi:adenylate kinase
MKILLIGPPASGKGTIGELLSSKLKVPVISGGDLLRAIPNTHPRYKELHAKMDVGDLAPSDLIADLLRERVSHPDCAQGYILDGWARKLDNLGYFDPGFDLVLFLNISEDTVVRRVSGRRMCEADGEIYNIYTMTPDQLLKCDSDFTQREDDKEEVVRERLKVYKEETTPVINYFKKQGILVEIDAEPSPEDIFKNICQALGID